jgi:hypothetical protein
VAVQLTVHPCAGSLRATLRFPDAIEERVLDEIKAELDLPAPFGPPSFGARRAAELAQRDCVNNALAASKPMKRREKMTREYRKLVVT